MKRFPRVVLAAFCVLLAAGCAHAPNPRTDFLELINRPRVPLTPQVVAVLNTNGLVQLRFSFASDREQRVPGYLLKQADAHGRRPVVIALHGTGSSKQNMLSLARKLATNGFVAVVIDGRYHGE